MKTTIKFFTNFFNSDDNSYIGLTSFKKPEVKKVEIKKENKTTVEKTALTGLLKRVS